MTEEIAEALMLGESDGDVASFLFEGYGGEDLVRDLALLVAGESDAGEESSGNDEPEIGEKEQDARRAEHGRVLIVG